MLPIRVTKYKFMLQAPTQVHNDEDQMYYSNVDMVHKNRAVQ